MKKTAILSIILFILCSSTFSQSLENAMWQLQNPAVAMNSELIGFSENNQFTCTDRNLANNQQSCLQGTFQLSEDNLAITVNDKTIAYALTWITQNKIALSANGVTLVYAKACSPDDHFLQNCLNGISGYSGGSYNQNDNTDNNIQPSKRKCGYCEGTGQCPYCNSLGQSKACVQNMYGVTCSDPYCIAKNHRCKHCGGTHICQSCNGTGSK